MHRCVSIPPLAGHTVGLTGDRRSEELTAHLEALGASVLLGPVLRTRPLSDDHHELRAATLSVIATPPDYLLATTGIGMRGWINAAAAWGLETELLGALRNTRVLARGPKAVGAIAEAGLHVWFTEPTGQTTAMIDHVLRQPDRVGHVAVQLPGAPMPELMNRLAARGAVVTPVAIYDWTWPDDLGPARRLVRAIADTRLSAVIFTSRPAVRNLVALAAAEELEAEVCAALGRTVLAACVGTVTADALRELTGAPALLPERPMLGMLAPTVAEEVRRVGHHHVRLEAGREVVVQGRRVDGDSTALLTDREAAVLNHLVVNASRTVGRDELVRAVWGDDVVDPSAIETIVARARRRLRSTGLTIRTVTGRGYLLGGELVPCTAGDLAAV